MTFPFGETVTLVRRVKAAEPDQFGNDVYTPTSVTVTDCVIWPRGSTEDAQGRDTITTGVAVLMQPGTAVAGIDAVLIAGQRYEVDGDPQTFRSPFTGRDPGVLLNLTRITG